VNGFRRQDGFTLVELVLLMVLLAFIAVVVMPRIGDLTGSRAVAAARKLQADMAYAQELAMTQHIRYRVYFNLAPAPAPQGYAVVNDANGNGTWGETGEFARDPSTGGSLSVTLNTGNYGGITLTSIGFTPSYVEFDTLGVPYANGTALAAVTSVTVSGGSTNQTVRVTNQTGTVLTP